MRLALLYDETTRKERERDRIVCGVSAVATEGARRTNSPLGVQLLAGGGQGQGILNANHAGQALGTAGTREQTKHHFRHSQFGFAIRGCNAVRTVQGIHG